MGGEAEGVVCLEAGGECWRVGDVEYMKGGDVLCVGLGEGGAGEEGRERVRGGVGVEECLCGRGGGDGVAGGGRAGARLRGSKGGMPAGGRGGTFLAPDEGPVEGCDDNLSSLCVRDARDTSKGWEGRKGMSNFPSVL